MCSVVSVVVNYKQCKCNCVRSYSVSMSVQGHICIQYMFCYVCGAGCGCELQIVTVYGHILYKRVSVSTVCVRSHLYTVCVLLCLWCRMWL